jgi:hypothetical protein
MRGFGPTASPGDSVAYCGAYLTSNSSLRIFLEITSQLDLSKPQRLYDNFIHNNSPNRNKNIYNYALAQGSDYGWLA